LVASFKYAAAFRPSKAGARQPVLEHGRASQRRIAIDAIATNSTIATAIRDAQADYLLALKANQPTLRSEIETFFADAPPASLESTTDVDKGHGRIEQRTVTVAREVDWLAGHRRFPGEVRLPDVATIIRVASRAELSDRGRFETRYYVSSAAAPTR
jgi:predicted transposase YbfD/YdcC